MINKENSTIGMHTFFPTWKILCFHTNAINSNANDSNKRSGKEMEYLQAMGPNHLRVVEFGLALGSHGQYADQSMRSSFRCDRWRTCGHLEQFALSSRAEDLLLNCLSHANYHLLLMFHRLSFVSIGQCPMWPPYWLLEILLLLLATTMYHYQLHQHPLADNVFRLNTNGTEHMSKMCTFYCHQTTATLIIVWCV